MINNILSKERFKQVINRLQNHCDLIDSLYKLDIDIINLDTLDSDIVFLLDKMYDTDNVSYWCWECDFGRNEKLMPMTAYDSTSQEPLFQINNLDELYEQLIKDLNEKE